MFIVIDSQKNSILNIKAVEYVNGKMEIKSYMSDFPFDFFLIINNAKELGDILGATLMQFIQEKWNYFFNKICFIYFIYFSYSNLFNSLISIKNWFIFWFLLLFDKIHKSNRYFHFLDEQKD